MHTFHVFSEVCLSCKIFRTYCTLHIFRVVEVYIADVTFRVVRHSAFIWTHGAAETNIVTFV